MIKRRLKSVLFILILCFSCALFAERSGDWEYVTFDKPKAAMITKYYNTDATHVEIPSVIDGYEVAYIMSGQASDGAFNECSDLISITIPNSVVDIGILTFIRLKKLEAINVTKDNKNFSSEGGVLFNKDKTILKYCPEGKAGEYIIPDHVTSIGEPAFYNCAKLTSIIMHDNITSIGRSAFYGCSGLTSITIPGKVKSIPVDAFNGCSSLRYIAVSDSITNIGMRAFRYCDNLEEINVSKGSKNFSSEDGILFNKDKTSLLHYPQTKTGEYMIPDGVKLIGDFAFADRDSVTSVIIPNSVTVIAETAFANCTGLTSIYIPDSLTIIGVAFKGCSGLTSVTLPDSIKIIGHYSFEGCSNLTSIIIPGNVTSIGYRAFGSCTSLTSITIPVSVVSTSEYAFEDCDNLVIFTTRGSYADTFANENGIKIEYID